MEKGRFSGVDLAKIIAIYFVMIHHVSDCGIDVINSDFVCLYVHSFIHCISYSCIDIFALATGFLCVNSSCRYSRIVNLWLSAFFWGLTMLTVCCLAGYSIHWKFFVKAAFPIWRNQYWFLTAYFMLFFFMPFLNKGIKGMSRKEFHHLFAAVAIFICGYSIYSGDLFSLRRGYSFPWLSIVYVIGAYIRLFNPCQWSASTCFMSAGGIAFITCLRQFISILIGYRIPGDRFCIVSYVSASTLCIAILIFLGCLKIDVGAKVGGLFKNVAATTFGIYLIHVQPFVWNCVWYEKLHQIKITNVSQMIVVVFGIATATFIVFSIFEYLRIKMFKKFGVDCLVAKIDNIIKR